MQIIDKNTLLEKYDINIEDLIHLNRLEGFGWALKPNRDGLSKAGVDGGTLWIDVYFQVVEKGKKSLYVGEISSEPFSETLCLGDTVCFWGENP